MYESAAGQFGINLKLDYTREQREKEVQDKKKNREKYRHNFSHMARMYRTGKQFR